MPALEAGSSAPQFELPAMNGPGFSSQDALKRGPVLLAFFKISCPVCQYAFPYLERIYKAYGKGNLSIVGISQNDKEETAAFIKRFGITFPVLLDDTNRYPASNAYGLTTVPTIFWISENGDIEIASVGWVKKDIEEIVRKAASTSEQASQSVFQPTEQIADFRAG